MNYKKAFDILKINRKHLTKEVKQAYFREALKYHPYKNKGDKECEEKLKKINNAYTILKKVYSKKKLNN